jgi:hypothetical protein
MSRLLGALLLTGLLFACGPADSGIENALIVRYAP